MNHTIVAVVLFLAAQMTSPANGVESGEINGAPFRIEIPANWNKGLVLYAHGYEVPGGKPAVNNSARMQAVRDAFLGRGFAFAQSAYSAKGWAVKEGIEDTEALRRYFVAKHGTPAETYIFGHSMGGHITMATIERYPEAYQGAMPMCGPLGAAADFMSTGVFDMLITFDALFPDTIGSPYQASPATAEKVKAAIAAKPDLAARYAQHFDRPVELLPDVLAFFHVILADLKARAGGEPFDNTNRIYSGFGDDAVMNRTVKRYRADPAAREYVRQYATPTGRTSDPMLAVHTTSDPLVLGSDVTAYDLPALLAGTSDRFVTRFVDATGHCAFTPEQTGHAFDALREWAKTGKRPMAGELR